MGRKFTRYCSCDLSIELLTSLQKWINYWLHYKSVTDFITNSITDFITKELLTSLQTQLLTSLQKCYWLHYKLNYWLHYKLNYWPHYKSITDFITDWLCCKVIITNANNVLNGHSDAYFSPPAGLILFLKIIFDRMSPINILEGLQLWTAKHNSFDISWSWIFGDKPTLDLDSACWNTSKNISPKFFPWGFRVAIILKQIFTTLCTPLRVLAPKVLYFWLEFH